jgi:hypothetical protein
LGLFFWNFSFCCYCSYHSVALYLPFCCIVLTILLYCTNILLYCTYYSVVLYLPLCCIVPLEELAFFLFFLE